MIPVQIRWVREGTTFHHQYSTGMLAIPSVGDLIRPPCEDLLVVTRIIHEMGSGYVTIQAERTEAR